MGCEKQKKHQAQWIEQHHKKAGSLKAIFKGLLLNKVSNHVLVICKVFVNYNDKKTSKNTEVLSLFFYGFFN